MKLFNKISQAFEELCFGAQASENSLPVVLSDDFSATGGNLNAPVINTELLTGVVSGWFDAKSFNSVAIQIQTGAGISAGIVTFEQTNNVTLSPAGNTLQVSDATSISANPVTSLTLAASATRLFIAPVIARYVRVRVSTAVVGGTVAATAVFSQQPFSNAVFNMQQASAGNFQTTATLAAGTALAADVGAQARATTGGVTAPYRLLASAATTNGAVVKASAGRLLQIFGLNNVASVRYLKLYNKASAPTVGTDVPVLTIALKASDYFEIDLNPYGQFFSTGIAFAITGAVADNDTTAIAANDILGLNVWYA